MYADFCYAIGMTNDQLIADYKIMIKADHEHLLAALAQGNRTHAHSFVDSIIDRQREIEDLQRDQNDGNVQCTFCGEPKGQLAHACRLQQPR